MLPIDPCIDNEIDCAFGFRGGIGGFSVFLGPSITSRCCSENEPALALRSSPTGAKRALSSELSGVSDMFGKLLV